jgi:serine/threonine-protein kinase
VDCRQVRVELESALGSSFTIERELGGGGMSCVYCAIETNPIYQKRVAIKVLPPGLGGLANAGRFRQEIAMLAALDHPNIVQLRSAGTAGDLLYYTMQWVEGLSLRERLERGALPIDDAISILRDVSSALEYAHGCEFSGAQGIVHRDMKPGNVLLSAHGALVADFGVAKALAEITPGSESITTAGMAVGTPAYMAPEQISADSTADHRIDIYALGVIGYEMLAGRLPFDTGTSAHEAMAAALTSSPRPLADVRRSIPAALAKLIMQCLEKNPADRPQTARELRQRLEGLRNQHEVDWVSRIARSKPARIAALLAAIALALSIVFCPPPPAPRGVAIQPFRIDGPTDRIQGWNGVAADQIYHFLAKASAEHDFNIQVIDPMASRAVQAVDPTEFARLTRAAVVVTGTVHRVADSVEFVAKIWRANGELISTLEPVRGPLPDPSAALRALASNVVTRIAIYFHYNEPVPLDTYQPRYDAYLEYEAGANRWVRLEFPQAIPHMLRAHALDTTFVLPLLAAAIAYKEMNVFATADSIAREIEQRRGQLTSFEQSTLDWVQAALSNEPGSRDTRLEAMEKAYERGRSDLVRYQIAQEHFGLNQACETVDILRDMNPYGALGAGWYVYYDYLTRSLHVLGARRAEERAAEAGVQQFPRRLSTLYYEARAAAAAGDTRRVRALLDSANGLPPQFGWSPSRVALLTALELRAHGHRDASQEVVGRAIAMLQRAPASQQQAEMFRFELARALYQAERWEEARALFESLAAAAPDTLPYQGYLGVLAARRGDSATARQKATALANWPRPYTHGEHFLWAARIAAQLGDRDEALERLDTALPIAGWEIERHVDIDLEPLRSDPRYRSKLAPQECRPFWHLNPRHW